MERTPVTHLLHTGALRLDCIIGLRKSSSKGEGPSEGLFTDQLLL